MNESPFLAVGLCSLPDRRFHKFLSESQDKYDNMIPFLVKSRLQCRYHRSFILILTILFRVSFISSSTSSYPTFLLIDFLVVVGRAVALDRFAIASFASLISPDVRLTQKHSHLRKCGQEEQEI